MELSSKVYPIVSAGGFKNCKEWGAEIDSACVIFSGDHDSGKTARMDAMQLLFTGKSSVGANTHSLSDLCPSDARVSISMPDWKIEWTLTRGKTISAKSYAEIFGKPCQVSELTGNLPATVKEFLSMTNEEKWSALSSVFPPISTPDDIVQQSPIKLTEDAQVDTQRIASAIGELKSSRRELDQKSPPPAYDGPPLSILEANIENLSAELSTMRKANARISRTEESLASKGRDLERTKSDLGIARNRLSLAQGRREYLQGVIDSNRNSGDEPEFVSALREQRASKQDAIKQCFKESLKILAFASKLSAEGQCMETISVVKAAQKKIEHSIEDIGDIPDFSEKLEPRTTMSAAEASIELKNVLSEIEKTTAEIGKLEAEMLRAQDAISRLLTEKASCGTLEDITEKEVEYARLDDMRIRAKSWDVWGRDEENREQLRKKIDSDISVFERLLAELRQHRADVINSNLKKVTAIANGYLWDGYPELRIELDSSGKLPAVKLSNGDGISFRTMSGSAQVVYGTVMLAALQDLSKAQFPVIFQECAEVNPLILGKLASALAKREKGCVFLSHYMFPENASRDVKVIECRQ